MCVADYSKRVMTNKEVLTIDDVCEHQEQGDMLQKPEMLKRIIAVENEVEIGYSNGVPEDVKTCGENEASGRYLFEGPGAVACCQD